MCPFNPSHRHSNLIPHRYICVCMYVHVYIYKCIYVFLYMYMYIYMCKYTYSNVPFQSQSSAFQSNAVQANNSQFEFNRDMPSNTPVVSTGKKLKKNDINMCIHMFIYICICICIRIHIYIYIYIYTYIYKYKYICIYIYV
jgi:Ca2+/Na+ antiporter